MTRAELLAAAQKAGLGTLLQGEGLPTMWAGHDIAVLEHFAELVSKQAIAEALISVSHAVAEEREACAQVSDGARALPMAQDTHNGGWCAASLQISQAIRARGQ